MHTVRTEVFFLASELVSKEVNSAGHLLAANGATIPCQRKEGQEKKQTREQENKSLSVAGLGNTWIHLRKWSFLPENEKKDKDRMNRLNRQE